jgi:hypothetical protein
MVMVLRRPKLERVRLEIARASAFADSRLREAEVPHEAPVLGARDPTACVHERG